MVAQIAKYSSDSHIRLRKPKMVKMVKNGRDSQKWPKKQGTQATHGQS